MDKYNLARLVELMIDEKINLKEIEKRMYSTRPCASMQELNIQRKQRLVNIAIFRYEISKKI